MTPVGPDVDSQIKGSSLGVFSTFRTKVCQTTVETVVPDVTPADDGAGGSSGANGAGSDGTGGNGTGGDGSIIDEFDLDGFSLDDFDGSAIEGAVIDGFGGTSLDSIVTTREVTTC